MAWEGRKLTDQKETEKGGKAETSPKKYRAMFPVQLHCTLVCIIITWAWVRPMVCIVITDFIGNVVQQAHPKSAPGRVAISLVWIFLWLAPSNLKALGRKNTIFLIVQPGKITCPRSPRKSMTKRGTESCLPTPRLTRGHNPPLKKGLPPWDVLCF